MHEKASFSSTDMHEKASSKQLILHEKASSVMEGGIFIFIYPENLSQKPKLWLWHFKDIVLIGIFGMISIYAYMQFRSLVPGTIVITYAIMTVRFDDVSVLDFIIYALKFFVLSQQEFRWRLEKYD